MNQQVEDSTPMEGVGRNISEANSRNLSQKRMKRGECPTCGTKTHKVNFFGKKTALTVEGQALYGRCLICNPVEGYSRRPPDQPVVPQTLEITDRDNIDDDAGTMVSGITLDYRLVQGARHWDHGMPEENFDEDTYNMEEFQRAPKVRPEPSIGEDEDNDDWRPTNRRYGDSNFGQPPPRRPPPHRGDHDPRDYDRGPSDYDMRGGPPGPGPRPGRGSMSRKASRSRYGGGSPPRFGGSNMMGVIEEKDTLTETSSGNKESLASGERNQARDRMGRYQSSPDPYGSSYDRRGGGDRESYRGNRFREEEKNEIEPPDAEGGDQWYHNDPQYASNEDGRNRQSQEIRFNPRDAGTRSVSSRSFGNEGKRGGDAYDPHESRRSGMGTREDNQGKKQGGRYTDIEFSNNQEPQDRYGDNDYNRNSSQGEYATKPPPAQLKKGDDLGNSRRSREEARYGGGRPKDDEGGSQYSGQGRHGQSRRGRPKEDEPKRRNGRGMPDDDNLEGPVSRPAASSRKARGRSEAKGSVNKDRVKMMFRQLSQPEDRHQRERRQDSVSLDEVPTIVACLNLPESTSLLRERAFEALAEVIWESGQSAKELVVDNKGIEALVQSMWQDMGTPSVQASAVELLFALAASTDGVADNDVLTEMNAEGAVDALLISMQTHVSVEAVQRSGCCTLCCLAAASSDNRDVNDGTLSGAVLSVVNAMDGQRNSLAVQEWGVRALYNQCVYSVNADGNKTALGKGNFDGGSSVDVIHRTMDIAKSELVTTEWACRLYWCISSSEDIASFLLGSNKPLDAVVNAIRSYHRNPGAGSLTQAAYGTLANFAKLPDQSHAALRDAGVVKLALGSMNFFSNEEGVNVEACALLANLALSPSERDGILRASGVKPIIKTMDIFSNSEVLQEEALRALVSLCVDSEDGKKAVSSDAAIKAIVQALQFHQDFLVVQETACSLLATLSSRQASVRQIVLQGGIHGICRAMNTNPRERRLQEAACTALRNISSFDDDIEDLLDEDNVGAVVQAMDSHPESESVQLNCCCVLWNLCSKSHRDPENVVSAGAIKNIVKVMQSHMESAAILEMACGALWSILNTSLDRKTNAVENGGIDAVTCVLVMHPGEPGCLAKACGVLSSVSVERVHAEAIANAQGISIVVEAMRNNSSNATVLEFGSLVLRNIVLVKPDCTEEASSAISTIINCMKDNPDEAGLQKEACNALWALAAQSESCKSKILALDGVTVIMNTLDRSSEYDVQEAARGAFNQLAMPSFG